MKPIKQLRYFAVLTALGCAVTAFSLVFFSTAAPGAARSTIVPPGVERSGDAEGQPAERPFGALAQGRAHIAAQFPSLSSRAPLLKRSLRVTPEQMTSFGLSTPAVAANTPLTVIVFEGSFDVSNAGPGISFTNARYIALVYDINGRQLAMTHISAEGAGLEKLLSGAIQ